MNKKIISTLIVLLFCACCLSMVSAENGTNESGAGHDMSGYIKPVSITNKGIEFSDGFVGFCLDSTKDSITADDGFASQKTGNDKIQNYVKLAIIEAYKQGCENNLAQIIASFADGSYKNSSDKVIAAVLASQETIGDNVTVELDDSVKGSFEFELLKDANGKKSDCLAYKVSLKEMPKNDTSGAAPASNTTDDNNRTDDGNTTNPTGDKKDIEKTENVKNQTVINEANNTIINNTTNNVVINENNTTVINQNNTKIINKTDDNPQNATLPQNILRTVGNPIFLLVVVIVIAAVVAVAIRRKD